MNSLGPHPDNTEDDVYSLGMTILNVIFPLNNKEKINFLNQNQIDTKINFLSIYYSKFFI